MKLGVFALGCKVNLFEIQAVAALAEQRGHQIVAADADVFLLNSCTVTAVSDRKNIRALHKIRKENPQAQIAVCGCLAQLDPDRLTATQEVAAVFGTASRQELVHLCEQLYEHNLDATLAAQTSAPEREMSLLPAGVPQGRTRALLKLEDGCDNYCSYCIIPYARGHVRSLPLADAVAEAKRLAAAGVQEIILTGIEISSYGRDLHPKCTLTDAIAALCTAVPDTAIRLGSLEPRTIDADFCNRLAGFGNLVPHFHLSLQSGCDVTLQRMKRRYTTARYAQSVDLLRTHFPLCAITTDLIVGFPGETEADFTDSLDFIRDCALADVHVFPYSIRSGTPAATMPQQIPQAEKEQRANRARVVASQLSCNYRTAWLGKTVRVLMEHPTSDGMWSGHTMSNFPVYVTTTHPCKNQYLTVQLTDLHQDGCRGMIGHL